MVGQIIEALFVIVFVGMILTNSAGFSNVVKSAGQTYAATVRGLGPKG